ncbi:MAG TPA: FAD/NAD(P)-binding protein [Steroidobacteraceae bacterium]|jgi:uncharacterized NAD(P)/FAD-binding protein YdhS
MRKTVAIVGAGFCGTVLAANLLRRPTSATDIVLIERGTAMGRGVAYAKQDFPYLLNVSAGRLSADSRDPQQFLRYARRTLQNVAGEDFLPRALYGDYLQDMLLSAERAAPEHVRLRRVFGEVTGIARTDAGQPLAAQFNDRPAILADRIVLALGNPPPAPPPWAADVLEHGAFRHDPGDLPKTLTGEHSVIIIGNGLTMADVATALSGKPGGGPMLQTISRRGLLPQPQAVFQMGGTRGADALLASTHSVRQVLKASRALASEIEKSGGDWREAIAHIRSSAPHVWRGLPEIERRRFVRHLQVHWDIHRHRLPPQLTLGIECLRRAGRLRIAAGRIQHIAPLDHRLRVSWRPRGSTDSKTQLADLVVNATGPNYSIERSRDPLVRALQAAGMISPDALQLGIRTAPFGACLDAQGHSARDLFYLGPMLRADHWDATGAIELRDHAESLAAHLAAGSS